MYARPCDDPFYADRPTWQSRFRKCGGPRAGISVSNHRQAQPGPLPSSSASSVSTGDVDASSESGLGDDDEEDEISWDVGKFVICRVPDSYREETRSDEEFWVGQIVKHQKGDKLADNKHVRLQWYEHIGDWQYRKAWLTCPRSEGQKPGRKRKRGKSTASCPVRWVDYVDKKSIQGNIELTKRGRIISKHIRWIQRWVKELWEKNPVCNSDSSFSESDSE